MDMPTLDPRSPKQRLNLWEQQATTRSCRYPGILSELLVLNFNLHTEHHLFPALPWFRLKASQEADQAQFFSPDITKFTAKIRLEL